MNRKKIIKYSLVGLLAIFITWLWIVPCRLFSDVSYSTVVEDRNGQLIGARISQDQQWRFPLQDSLPEKYEKCLVRFEDKGFYHHLGVSPSAGWQDKEWCQHYHDAGGAYEPKKRAYIHAEVD